MPLINPSNDQIRIDTEESSVDITGWKLRSAISGKSFILQGIKESSGTLRLVVLNVGDVAYIRSKGSTSSSRIAEGLEYHLYLGASDIAWGAEHDSIELVNKEGLVIDRYSY